MSGQRPFRGVSREMRRAARRLRAEETGAEAALWEALRGRRLAGLRFRRQHAVERFVLDFYGPEHHLAVELDGEVHDAPTQAERDAERSRYLNTRGYHVIRFRNDEVMADLPDVLSRIAAAVQCSAPPLPPAGEGAGG